jgi:hypothetical protein
MADTLHRLKYRMSEKKMRKSAMFFSLSGTVTDVHLRPRRDEHAEP